MVVINIIKPSIKVYVINNFHFLINVFQVQLQAFVENIRDKLAENIHEMWAVTKIETGWIYGEERDDQEMLHPCLTQFQNLPMAEKRYNIQLALQTLR